jgi:hypothetical protein
VLPRWAIPPAARQLLAFHLALLAFWACVQFHYRVVAKVVHVDPTFAFGVVSWALIALAFVLFARFAREGRGTLSARFASVAGLLASVDLVAETLQFAPQLGLSSVIPDDKHMAELLVRCAWASCEFAMRVAVFMALWHAQVGADKRVRSVFLGLVLLHWLLAITSFVILAEPFAAWSAAHSSWLRILKVGPFLGMTWLSMIVWVNRRVVTHPRNGLWD